MSELRLFFVGVSMLCGWLLKPAQAEDCSARYVGMLPCADCSGIRIELTLRSTPEKDKRGTYELKQTYEGTRDGDLTFLQKGEWRISRGSATNRRAAVYELDPAKSESRQYFLRVNQDTLRLLNRQRGEIPPHVPHTLQRIR